MGKKKYDPLEEVMNITKVNIASSVGFVAISSLPDSHPTMSNVKNVDGSSLSMLSTIESGKSVLKSLKSLKEL